jgi:Spy/CpxP family protein refolding chaperone
MQLTNKLSKIIVQKKTISMILFFCILVSPIVALAQKQNSAPDSKEVINRISKELGLNDTQKTKVEAILDNEKKKVEAVFNEERKKLQQIQEITRTNLQAVLTPEQMEKLDKKMREQSSKNNPQKK